MKKSFIHIFYISCLLILFSALSATKASAQNERRQVKVIAMMDSTEIPVPFVAIQDTKTDEYLGETDGDGKALITCDAKATLSFSSMEIVPKKEKVKGRKELVIIVELLNYDEKYKLNEAKVTTKSKFADAVRFDSTEVMVTGNSFNFSTRVKVGKRLMNSDRRLSFQAILYNRDRHEAHLFRPMVLDGKRYGATQRRLYGSFGDTLIIDPLGKYEEIFAPDSIGGKGDNRFYNIKYKGNTRAITGKRDFIKCDVTYIIENYTDTCSFQRQLVKEGVINPLRFLDVPFKGMYVWNPVLYPKKDKAQACDENGEVSLLFDIGASNLDLELGNNAQEIKNLEEKMRDIASMDGSTLKSFSMYATASPEGSYDFNKRLADRRMASARAIILNTFAQHRLRTQYGNTFLAEVAPWDSVVSLMRKDSLEEQANAVQHIINEYKGNHDLQSQKMRTLPFYKSLLVDNYCKRLRKVSYAIKYVIERNWTLDEIRAHYKKGDYMTKYEFFRMFRSEKNPEEKERICKDALKSWPDFWLAANELAALKISQGKPDSKILESYISNDKRYSIPMAMNQMHALMEENQYDRADTIAAKYAQDLTQTDSTKLMHAVVNIFMSRFKKYLPTVEASSPVNCVLVRLAAGKNAAALEACEALDDSLAFSHYLWATCHSRLGKPDKARKELEQALDMDIELDKEAEIDGDLRDIFKEIRGVDENGNIKPRPEEKQAPKPQNKPEVEILPTATDESAAKEVKDGKKKDEVKASDESKKDKKSDKKKSKDKKSKDKTSKEKKSDKKSSKDDKK